MHKFLACFSFFLITIHIWSQEAMLPPDFRQHNLTQFNANLLNPSYGMDWNDPNSFSIWTRWQWQTVDGDPTSIYANYTHQLNQESALGIGFLQHNTGVFLDIGTNVNYAYTFLFENNIKVIAGFNLNAFQEKLADDRFIADTDDLSQLEDINEFIVSFSPGIRLQVNQFSFGLALENALDFSLSGGDRKDFRILTGTLSNDFPVTIFSDVESFVRPIIYIRTIPDQDTQVGINALFSTSKFWVQGGYNSFYGIAGGLGATFAKQFSIGGLLEFGTDTSLSDEDPTFELIASYHFGKPDNRKKVVGFDVEKDDTLALERIRIEENKKLEAEKLFAEKEEAKKREGDAQKLNEQRLEEEKRLATEKQQQFLAEQQRKTDSIGRIRLAEQKLEAAKQKEDSIARLQDQEVAVKKNEVYKEVAREEGVEPGFYLIANVFGTKRYYVSFMLTLKKRGLDPKSFYRSKDKFNYVYLERYNTIDEARKARDSKFFGKYPDKTWIFRVRGR